MYIEQHCKINEENKVHSPIDIVDDTITRCFFGLRGGHVSGDGDVFRTCLTRVLGLSLKGLKNACQLNNIYFNDLPRENLIVFCDDFSAHFDTRGYHRASKSRRGTRLENHYWFGTDFDKWAPIDLDSLFSHFDNIFVTNLKSPIVSSSIGKQLYPIPIGPFPDTDSHANLVPSENKHHLVLSSFDITNHSREGLNNVIQNLDYVTHFPPNSLPSRTDFYALLSEHLFSICPEGNACDTFRTWESILCNCVPIVQRSFCTDIFSKIWPMIKMDLYKFDEKLLIKMCKFLMKNPNFQYVDTELLKQENISALIKRIKYECDRT